MSHKAVSLGLPTLQIETRQRCFVPTQVGFAETINLPPVKQQINNLNYKIAT